MKTLSPHPYPYNSIHNKSLSILKPTLKMKNPTITIPRRQLISTHQEVQSEIHQAVPEHSTTIGDMSTNASDDDITVVPGPDYKVQQGTIKKVFLDKIEDKDFLVQVNNIVRNIQLNHLCSLSPHHHIHTHHCYTSHYINYIYLNVLIRNHINF